LGQDISLVCPQAGVGFGHIILIGEPKAVFFKLKFRRQSELRRVPQFLGKALRDFMVAERGRFPFEPKDRPVALPDPGIPIESGRRLFNRRDRDDVCGLAVDFSFFDKAVCVDR